MFVMIWLFCLLRESLLLQILTLLTGGFYIHGVATQEQLQAIVTLKATLLGTIQGYNLEAYDN